MAHTGEYDMVSAPGLLGEFGVLDMHAQTLAVTQAGVVTMQSGGEITKLVVGPGFAEVGADNSAMLVDQCESTEGIDKAAAQPIWMLRLVTWPCTAWTVRRHPSQKTGGTLASTIERIGFCTKKQKGPAIRLGPFCFVGVS